MVMFVLADEVLVCRRLTTMRVSQQPASYSNPSNASVSWRFIRL